MRDVAPTDFDVSKFFDGIYIFQEWELFPGHSTSGVKHVRNHMDVLKVPARLDGLRVLEIAPWNGFFSFECVRRGATEVVSLGPDDPELTGYNKTRDVLEIDNCKYIQASVYDLDPEVHGTFDIVFFLGVIYHLRHPLLALDRIYDVTKHRLFVDSPVIDRYIFDQTLSPEKRETLLESGKVFHELPMTYFTKARETGDSFNWFMPNIKCFKDFVESSGFDIYNTYDDGGNWCSLSAIKGNRDFVVGIEGFNPNAWKA